MGAANKNSGKDYDLRVLVGHANLLDKLSESVSEFNMFAKEVENGAAEEEDAYSDSDSCSESEDEEGFDEYQSLSSSSSSDTDSEADSDGLDSGERYYSHLQNEGEEPLGSDEEADSNYILGSQPSLYKCYSQDVRLSSVLLHMSPEVTEEALLSDEESEEEEEEDLGTLAPVYVS